MGTRSCIGYVCPDRTILWIRCHWDGYPLGVGKKLITYYSDESRVKELIPLGDLSSLGQDPKICKVDAPLDTRWKDLLTDLLMHHGVAKEHNLEKVKDKLLSEGLYCTVFADSLPMHTSPNRKKFLEYIYNTDVEYIYLFSNNKWMFSSNRGPYSKFKNLTTYLEKKNKNS